MKDKIRSQKGFAASDALIAILIIALFAGLISNISYNIYLANSSIKRMSKATGYIVDIFEYIDKNYYDDITIEKIKSDYNYLNEYTDIEEPKNDNMQRLGLLKGTVDNSYEITLILDRYHIDENTLDLVKQVKMRVKYKLGNKEQIIEMKRIKQRENIEIPNKPDLNSVELGAGEKVYPIKKVNEEWIVCDYRDNTWYEYENGNLAIILKTDKDLNIGEKIDLDNLSENEIKYTWIPRYAYNGTEVLFLFSNSNKYIKNEEGYDILKGINEDLDEDLYEIPKDFELDEKQLEGIWVENDETDAYKILYNAYELKN